MHHNRSENPKNTHNIQRVCLLKGGWNGEREVSLLSAAGCSAALKSRGFDVFEYDLDRDLTKLISFLKETNPDVVFLNALHGVGVEDGKLQSVMEILRLPYTGSNVAASAISFDKSIMRHIFERHGIPVTKGCVEPFEKIQKNQSDTFSEYAKIWGLPFVMKPLAEGSSLGVTIVHTLEDLRTACEKWDYGFSVLLEAYIPGRELSVAMKGHEALGILELIPHRGFYDYEAKYTDGLVTHVIPQDIDEDEKNLLLKTASDVALSLEVSGVTRVDFRYDENRPKGQRHFVLELNALPGMTPLSIVPEIAAEKGISYEDLCQWMVENPIYPEK